MIPCINKRGWTSFFGRDLYSIYTASLDKRLLKWGRISPCITTKFQDGYAPKLFRTYLFIASIILLRKKVQSEILAETATEATKRPASILIKLNITNPQFYSPLEQSSVADMKPSQILFCFISCSLTTALAASIPAAYDLTLSNNTDANITDVLNLPLNLTLPLDLTSANSSSK